MDALAKVGTVVFDKTGTLTHGEFAVAAVHADDSCPDHPSHNADNVHIGEYSDKEKILLHLAAHAEHFTTHLSVQPCGLPSRKKQQMAAR